MAAELTKNALEVDDITIDTKVFPDGVTVLEVHRGQFTHIITLSASGQKCEVVNTVKSKKPKPLNERH